MKLKTNRKAGFTLVEIMIVVAIIGLLAAIAIPNFVRARETAQTNACVNNLRQIDGAKDQLALETGLSTGDAAPAMAAGALLDYLRNEPLCPVGDTAYTVNIIGTPPACASAAAVDHNAAYN
jgi:prepilin-type N-terminal cleavage/methylation domain-containing protein